MVQNALRGKLLSAFVHCIVELRSLPQQTRLEVFPKLFCFACKLFPLASACFRLLVPAFFGRLTATAAERLTLPPISLSVPLVVRDALRTHEGYASGDVAAVLLLWIGRDSAVSLLPLVHHRSRRGAVVRPFFVSSRERAEGNIVLRTMCRKMIFC